MLLDDGNLKIYKVCPKKSKTGKPIKELVYLDEAYYSIINDSISEYYKAKQADVQIDLRVEILQNKRIHSNDIIIIDDEKYEVGRIYHGTDEDGIPITDITLAKAVEDYEFRKFL